MAATLAEIYLPHKKPSEKNLWTVRCHSDFRKQWLRVLTRPQLCVLLAIASYWSRKKPEPYPSEVTLAELTGYSERQVRRAISALVEYRLIAVLPRAQGKGNRYLLLKGDAPCG